MKNFNLDFTISSSTLFSIGLSLKVAILSTIAVFIVGTLLAYLFATSRHFKGKTILEIIVTLPLVLPPTVIGYYLMILWGRNGLLGKIIYENSGWTIMFTWWAAVLSSFVVSLPLMVKSAQAAIESVDQEMIDSSTILGYSHWETAYYVIFPLAKRGLFAGLMLSFARGIGEFGATLMLAGNIPGRTDTMPIAIYSQVSSGNWETAHLYVLTLTLISGTILLLAHKFSQGRHQQ